MSEQSQFLFAVCQRGAEPALKSEVARMERGFRFAYSRPGFVTFRLPDDRVWGGLENAVLDYLNAVTLEDLVNVDSPDVSGTSVEHPYTFSI